MHYLLIEQFAGLFLNWIYELYLACRKAHQKLYAVTGYQHLIKVMTCWKRAFVHSLVYWFCQVCCLKSKRHFFIILLINDSNKYQTILVVQAICNDKLFRKLTPHIVPEILAAQHVRIQLTTCLWIDECYLSSKCSQNSGVFSFRHKPLIKCGYHTVISD